MLFSEHFFCNLRHSNVLNKAADSWILAVAAWYLSEEVVPTPYDHRQGDEIAVQ